MPGRDAPAPRRPARLGVRGRTAAGLACGATLLASAGEVRADPTEVSVSIERAAGIAIARMHVGFERILFSPKVRASRTAELAVETWPAEQRELAEAHPPLAAGFDGAAGATRYSATPSRPPSRPKPLSR